MERMNTAAALMAASVLLPGCMSRNAHVDDRSGPTEPQPAEMTATTRAPDVQMFDPMAFSMDAESIDNPYFATGSGILATAGPSDAELNPVSEETAATL